MTLFMTCMLACAGLVTYAIAAEVSGAASASCTLSTAVTTMCRNHDGTGRAWSRMAKKKTHVAAFVSIQHQLTLTSLPTRVGQKPGIVWRVCNEIRGRQQTHTSHLATVTIIKLGLNFHIVIEAAFGAVKGEAWPDETFCTTIATTPLLRAQQWKIESSAGCSQYEKKRGTGSSSRSDRMITSKSLEKMTGSMNRIASRHTRQTLPAEVMDSSASCRNRARA